MYLTFVFYVPEDSHKVGWNVYQFIVYTKLILVHFFTYVVTIVIHIQSCLFGLWW